MTATEMRQLGNWLAKLRGAVRLRRFRGAASRPPLSGLAERLLRQHEAWLRAQGHQEGKPPVLEGGAPDAFWMDTQTGAMIFVVVAATEDDLEVARQRAQSFAHYRNAVVHVVVSERQRGVFNFRTFRY